MAQVFFGFLLEGSQTTFVDLSNQPDLVTAYLARCLNIPNIGATTNEQPITQFIHTPTEAVSIVLNAQSVIKGVILEGY